MEALRIVSRIRLRRSLDPVRILDVNVIQESLRSGYCVAKMLQEHYVTVRHDLTHSKSRQGVRFFERVPTLTSTILRGRENLE
jgi:hypothetical protein